MSEAETKTLPTLRTILAATDFSQTADLALERACELALRHGAKLVLAHAITYQATPAAGTVPVPVSPEIDRQVLALSREKLEELAQGARDKGVEVQSVDANGAPARCIVEIAKQQRAQLIVIGTRGLSGFEHLLLGSTAEQVVRKASCPVLTIHPDDHAPLSGPQTVIIPTEPGGDPIPAIQEVIRLLGPSTRAARLLLVYSDHLPSYLQPLIEDIGIDQIGFDEIQTALQEQLAPIASRLAELGFEVETLIEQGDPASVITNLATSRLANLVVMQTRGLTGFAHLLLGSTAERVVQHAACPVLTMRRDPAE